MTLLNYRLSRGFLSRILLSKKAILCAPVHTGYGEEHPSTTQAALMIYIFESEDVFNAEKRGTWENGYNVASFISKLSALAHHDFQR